MDYRYERKFLIKNFEENQIESIIKSHQAQFSEIFESRIVNNIYFDTINMLNFSDNIIGISKRSKIRIRWYGSTFGHVEKPILEIKIKKGLLGRKIKYPLKSFSLNNNFNQEYIQNIFQKSKLPANINNFLKTLKISLLNNYKRKYFKSANNKFRITVDSLLKYYKVNLIFNNFINKMVDKESLIMELKYNQNLDDQVMNITNGFPFRLTKNSKYINGIEKLYY